MGYYPYQNGYYPQIQPQTPTYPQQTVSAGIAARLVSGREEAVAAQVIPDGTVWVFADLAHNVLYTKQINPQTLAADFREFRGTTEPVRPEPQYVTMGDFERLRAEVEQIKAGREKGGEKK